MLEVSDSKWTQPSNLDRLAETMVSLYKTIKSKFSVDEHRHYLLTPRHLTEWILGLLRYDTRHEDLLDVFAYEARRLLRDRLVDSDSQNRFDVALQSVLRTDWRHSPPDDKDIVFTPLGGQAIGGGEEESLEGKVTEKTMASSAPRRRLGWQIEYHQADKGWNGRFQAYCRSRHAHV